MTDFEHQVRTMLRDRAETIDASAQEGFWAAEAIDDPTRDGFWARRGGRAGRRRRRRAVGPRRRHRAGAGDLDAVDHRDHAAPGHHGRGTDAGGAHAQALVVASLRRLQTQLDDPAARAEIEARIAAIEAG